MRIPRVPLCQCRCCMKTPIEWEERHRRYHWRRAIVHNWNKSIRSQKVDLENIEREPKFNWKIGRYTD